MTILDFDIKYFLLLFNLSMVVGLTKAVVVVTSLGQGWSRIEVDGGMGYLNLLGPARLGRCEWRIWSAYNKGTILIEFWIKNNYFYL